jgi:hypothetical protein
LIAVHDEEEQVEVAIRSLTAQESPPELHDEDAVRVVNADSMPVPSFLSEAMRRLREGIGGVGGVFSALKEHILASDRREHVEGTLRISGHGEYLGVHPGIFVGREKDGYPHS